MKKAAPAKNRREKPAINRFGCSASDYTRSGASRAQADHLCWHHPVFADGFARIDAEIRPGGSKAASGSTPSRRHIDRRTPFTKTRRAQAAISYTSVTLTFFSTIYATLTFGYDPSPFILEIVSHAAMAGLDLKPWMTDIGALDAAGAPTDKLRHGSTFVTTMLVTKLFVPVKLPLAAALTPAVSRALRRYGVLGKAR